MSLNYDPGTDVKPNGTWDTTFLSDRDVSAQIPINFVPHPAVYVSKACFGLNRYEDDATEACLSNLLSSQIRRYVIDIYWDSVNQHFGLCPVEIPPTSTNASQIATSEGDHTVQAPLTTTSPPSIVQVRQPTTTFVSNSTSAGSSDRTSSATSATSTVLSTNGNSQTFQLGPYQCSNTLTLASVTSVFSDYLEQTANTLDAKLLVWVLNLHLASTYEEPSIPRSRIPAAQLPNATAGVRSYLDSLNDVLYTPGTLLSDRQNLNTSWYRRGSRSDFPLMKYFTTYNLSNGDMATDDGWPDENYIQVVRGNRMLIGFGDIDPSIEAYNASADGDRVYPPGYIWNLRQASFQSDGEINSGCYYNSDEFTVTQVNNSWAVSAINAINPPDLGNSADNLTTCGIGQLLNVTIDDATADQNPIPYQQFGNNAIFSWAYGEPQNDSSTGVHDGDNYRCALMVSNNDYRGHWRVAYCNQAYRVACREAESPYLWRISSYDVPFDSAEAACTGNTSFDVPRTGLENTYLYNKILSDSQQDSSLLNGIWINFNSLAVGNCWITTGINGTCPYYQDSSATHSRQILIPTIAALIVLILTVLTVLAKCGGNVRNSRIRRRGEGGWNYEGVPS